MEITDRTDLGSDLRAPQSGSSGRSPWHYALVSHTQPGDIVFHFHETPADGRALVGWSEVVGPLKSEAFEWVPHSGPSKGQSITDAAWIMPLGSLHRLDNPIPSTQFDRLRDEILKIEADLRERAGAPTYFPFTKYGANGMRAAQAYLTKVPKSLALLLQREFRITLDASETASGGAPLHPASNRRGAQGFMRDAEIRQAIELRAVDVAIDHYRALGAIDIETLGKPYDIRLKLRGIERHIEVKGSRGAVDTVFLTRNEVSHAREFPATDLVLVENIQIERSETAVTATGGELSKWEDWHPADSSLEPQEFRYRLPPRTT